MLIAHAQLERDAVLRAQRLVELVHRRLHAEARPHRALGIVAVRHRRAEDRHHVVADVLVDMAAEAHDLLAKPREDPLEQPLDRLGVELRRRPPCSRRGRRTARSTVRRSSSVGDASATAGASASGTARGASAALGACSDAPHAVQNRASSGAGSPHSSQRRSSAAPHPMQKRAPVGFSAEHASQRAIGVSSVSRDIREHPHEYHLFE